MDKELTKLILNSISEGVFTIDQDCIITSFNKSAEKITGFKASEAVGKHCFDIFRTEVCHRQCALKDTLKSHIPIENARVSIITRDGRELPISVTTTMLENEESQIIGAVEFFRDITEIKLLQKNLDQKSALESIISVNPKMQSIINLLPDIAASECNVLIQGPSGCGKELFAQVIHGLSPRRYGSYIKLNCAALPANLLESELFGYEKGAFTDAKKNKPGQFSLANNGTLLLDEIGEMDMALQVKLLRVLNNGEYRPLGSTKTCFTNARIIAATNGNLEEAISEGRFREDLYYRINVVNLDIPPLRQRPEDIPILVNYFIKIFRKKSRKTIERISPEALAVIRQHPLPGNVRELENAVEHAFVMCHDSEIGIQHLPQHIISRSVPVNGAFSRKHNEKDIILETLRRYRGNKAKTARELGMHRTTLWRKIKVMGIEI